uniref:Right handed beta helix domain-containing protein n=1 Tax=Trypanosoma vivax (strain Y486) TaxID=1055687 RepID=G0TTD9_TRYVY|nr:conserved hypothetical protein, fragment [Trypanosoma vivax Y486]
MDPRFTRAMSALNGQEVRQTRVGKSGTSCFRQITDAILVSRPFDRIEVESGTYFESVTIRHPLELCSAKDTDPPLIVTLGPCVTINTNGPVLLKGIVIVARGSKASDSQGILVECGSPRIMDCEVSSIYVTNDSTPEVTHCRIVNSSHGNGLSIMGNSGGVYAQNDISGHNSECVYINTSGKPALHHNRITEKAGTYCAVVLISGRLLGKCEAYFHDNIIRGGGETANQSELDPASAYSPRLLTKGCYRNSAALLSITNGAEPHIFGNLLCNGVMGISFRKCHIQPERFKGNRIVNCSAWGIFLHRTTSLHIEGNDIQSCGGGIYVSPTGPSDGKSSDALNASSNAEINITVSKCLLKRNYHYGILVDKTNVSITECGVSESDVGIALLGNCSASEIMKNTLVGNNVAGISVLRRGIVSLEENNIIGGQKGMYGVFVQDGSHVTLRTSRVTAVETGVYLCDSSRITMENNEIRDVSIHHAVIAGGSHGVLTGNTVHSSVCASLVVTGHSECIIKSNTIHTSQKEGVLVESGSNAVVEQNSMSAMQKTIYVSSGSTALVKGNGVGHAHYGVVVSGKGSTSMVTGNTFRGMSAPAVYALEEATAKVLGNSFVDSSATCIQVDSGAEATVEESTFVSCSSGVVHADGSGTICRVHKCHMEQVSYGVRFTRDADGDVIENHIAACKSAGIICDTRTNIPLHNNTITGSETGLLLSAKGDVSNIIIQDCQVGIVACPRATSEVRNVRVVNCLIGLSILQETSVIVSAALITASHRYGVLVAGTATGAKIRETTIENCGAAGVAVKKTGACFFENCCIQNNTEEGILLQDAWAVVFDNCIVTKQARGVRVIRQDEAVVEETNTLSVENEAGRKRRGGLVTKREALLRKCTIDGDNCKTGVLATPGGSAVRLEYCKISARCPGKGVGLTVLDDAILNVVHCDVIDCSWAGFVASCSAQLVVNYVTVSGCRTGVLFKPSTSGDAETACHLKQPHTSLEGVVDNTTKTSTNTSGDAVMCPTFSQLTVSCCTETGVRFGSRGIGKVTNTVVDCCSTGIVVEPESLVMLETTEVRASVDCGLVVIGPTLKKSYFAHLIVGQSGCYGVRVCEGVGSDNQLEKLEDVGVDPDDMVQVTLKALEITENKGGGLLVETPVFIEDCTIVGNDVAGVICSCVQNEGRSVFTPIFTSCHLMRNVNANLLVKSGAVPELRNCVLEDSSIGVKVVDSAASMTQCILRRHGTGVAISYAHAPVGDVNESTDTRIMQCVLSCNEIGVSSSGSDLVCTNGALHVENTVFDSSTKSGVHVGPGPCATLLSCKFEACSKAVTVSEGADLDVDGCTFLVNLQGIHVTSPRRIEVRQCNFSQHREGGITVEGRECTAQSVHIGIEEASVRVFDNSFELDRYGLVVETATETYVFNNNFRACSTGVAVRGAQCCCILCGNTFEENRVGCLCERQCEAQLWRNDFCKNSDHGILSVSAACPTCVENVFRENVSISADANAVCVRDGGAGNFYHNQYVGNARAVHVENTGSATVFVGMCTFDGNHTGVNLGKGARVHVVLCSFMNDAVTGVRAAGEIEKDCCIMAYNYFSSASGVAATVCSGSMLTVFRCIFQGSKTGLWLQGGGHCFVCESLFQGVKSGVCAEAEAQGHVEKVVFLRCGMVSELHGHSNTTFKRCHMLAQCLVPQPLIVLHNDAVTTFTRCEIIGWAGSSEPLLRSHGGGAVQCCTFAAGETAAELGVGCSTVVSGNSFVRGAFGVVMDMGSTAVVEKNAFYRHRKAAVRIMNKAGGSLVGNIFAQAPEGGGVLAGMHNVTVAENKESSGSNTLPKIKMSLEDGDVMSRFVSLFIEFMEGAPHWVKHEMSGIPSMDAVPPAILEALTKEERQTGEEEQVVEGEMTPPRPEVGQSEARSTKVAVKRRPGSAGKRGQSSPRGKKTMNYSFTPSDDILNVPQSVRDKLLLWLEQNNITLLMQREQKNASVPSSAQGCAAAMLNDVDQQMLRVREEQLSQHIGVLRDVEPTEQRGEDSLKVVFKKSERGAVVRARSPAKGLAFQGRNTLRSFTSISLSVVGTGHESSLPPSPPHSHLSTCKQTPVAVRKSPRNKGLVKESTGRRTVYSGGKLPPPLWSTKLDTQSKRRPMRGLVKTVAESLHASGLYSNRAKEQKLDDEATEMKDETMVQELTTDCENDDVCHPPGTQSYSAHSCEVSVFKDAKELTLCDPGMAMREDSPSADPGAHELASNHSICMLRASRRRGARSSISDDASDCDENAMSKLLDFASSNTVSLKAQFGPNREREKASDSATVTVSHEDAQVDEKAGCSLVMKDKGTASRDVRSGTPSYGSDVLASLHKGKFGASGISGRRGKSRYATGSNRRNLSSSALSCSSNIAASSRGASARSGSRINNSSRSDSRIGKVSLSCAESSGNGVMSSDNDHDMVNGSQRSKRRKLGGRADRDPEDNDDGVRGAKKRNTAARRRDLTTKGATYKAKGGESEAAQQDIASQEGVRGDATELPAASGVAQHPLDRCSAEAAVTDVLLRHSTPTSKRRSQGITGACSTTAIMSPKDKRYGDAAIGKQHHVPRGNQSFESGTNNSTARRHTATSNSWEGSAVMRLESESTSKMSELFPLASATQPLDSTWRSGKWKSHRDGTTVFGTSSTRERRMGSYSVSTHQADIVSSEVNRSGSIGLDSAREVMDMIQFPKLSPFSVECRPLELDGRHASLTKSATSSSIDVKSDPMVVSSTASTIAPTSVVTPCGKALLAALESEHLREPIFKFPPHQDGAGAYDKGPSLRTLNCVHVTVPTHLDTAQSAHWDEGQDDVEDVVALLRWLVEMREKKMMTSDGFDRATECIRRKSGVDFFLREREDLGVTTVVVRLPQSPEETTVFPLAHTNSKERVMDKMRDTASVLRNRSMPAVAKPRCAGSNCVESEDVTANLPLLHLENEGAKSPSERRPESQFGPSSVALCSVCVMPSPEGFPLTCKETSALTDCGTRLQLLSQCANDLLRCSRATNDRPARSSNSSQRGLAGYCRIGRQVAGSSTASQVSHKVSKVFDPANPTLTSPFLTTQDAAAIIAAGTANFMA